MTRTDRTRPASRGGFTLVELLVVIAIIAVLVGLSGAAYFGWINSQREDATSKTVEAVRKALQQQVKAVLDRADKEDIPATVQQMANFNNERARVIWRKLRLKQEFPMTFAEAREPWKYSATQAPDLLPTDLPAKRIYLTAVGARAGGTPGESSACLLLALQQNRGGVALKPEDLGAAVADTDGDGLPEVVDGWGNPLAFFRFPVGNPDLEAANPVAAGPKARFADPLDPSGVLLTPDWYGPTFANPPALRQVFERNLHPISPDGARAYYTVPAIASAGRNGALGLSWPTMGVTSAADAQDNIYSFGLRLGAQRKGG